MIEKEVTQDLMRAMMFFGLVKGWEVSKLLEEYDRLGISKELVDEILNQMIETSN